MRNSLYPPSRYRLQKKTLLSSREEGASERKLQVLHPHLSNINQKEVQYPFRGTRESVRPLTADVIRRIVQQ